MLKTGIIGRGTISGAHERAYKQIAEGIKTVEVVAYCDIREERLEEVKNVRTYTDIDAFLEGEKGKLDYVDICLPTYLHAEVAIKAMKAGFNVLSEKPMALNYELAQEMCRVAKETGKHFMVAHCSRFMGAVKVMREYCENGKLGKVRNAEFYREGGSMGPMGYKNWFRDVNLSGGAMLDLHVHDVDLIRDLFGMPKAVSAAAMNHIPGAGYDAMAVNYMYDDMFVSAKCDWTIAHDKFNTRAIRVNYEKGYIFLDRTADRNVFVKVDTEGNVEDLWDKADINMFYNEIVYYTECLVNGKYPELCPPEETAETVKIVMAEMKSADMGGAKVEL